jgi:DNA-directed RNA polymerase sigma subunit (sigma70/sigma32)
VAPGGTTPTTDAPPRWVPLHSAEEEARLAERARAGDRTARNHLILANLRLVPLVARPYRCRLLPFEDLVQAGNLGLIRASADFDPAVHLCRFATYAELRIRAHLHRALITAQWPVRYPPHAHATAALEYVAQAWLESPPEPPRTNSPAGPWPR